MKQNIVDLNGIINDYIDSIQSSLAVTVDNVVSNPDKTLTINFSDGYSHTTDVVVGDKGAKGDRGVGIEGIELLSDLGYGKEKTWVIRFDDDSSELLTLNNGDMIEDIEATDVNLEVPGYTNTYTVKTFNGLSFPLQVANGSVSGVTPENIKLAYENNPDTNAFDDAAKDKLADIEANATRDQTGEEIKILYEAQADTNAYTDSDKAKVDSLDEDIANVIDTLEDSLASKQDTLVNQTNIKSINGESLIGAGDITISAGSGGFAAALYLTSTTNTLDNAYNTLSYTPEANESTASITCNSGETAGDVYLFDLPIDTTKIDAGRWTFNFHANVSSDNGDTRLRVEGFMRSSDGTETTLYSATSPELNNGTSSYVEWETTQPVFTVDPTAIYGLRVFASTTANNNRTVTYTLGNGNATFTSTPVATRHDQLRARDKADSHPIEAITGLRSELDDKAENTDLTDGSVDIVAKSLTVEGDIIQSGSTYETHAEQVYTTKDMIITRDGAVGGLIGNEVTGIKAKLYDGTNDGMLVFDKDGVAKVGDEGSLQALATREDSPTDAGVAVWDGGTSKLVTTKEITLDTLSVPTINGRTTADDSALLDQLASVWDTTDNDFALEDNISLAVPDGQVFVGDLTKPYPRISFMDKNDGSWNNIMYDSDTGKFIIRYGNGQPFLEIYHEGNMGTIADFEAALDY